MSHGFICALHHTHDEIQLRRDVVHGITSVLKSLCLVLLTVISQWYDDSVNRRPTRIIGTCAERRDSDGDSDVLHRLQDCLSQCTEDFAGGTSCYYTELVGMPHVAARHPCPACFDATLQRTRVATEHSS